MRQPTKVPIFGDCCDYPRTFPNAYTPPPAEIDTTESDASNADGAVSKLMNFCLRRHGPIENPNINIAFGDFSVRSVGLKELWSLNWHRQWVAERKGELNGGSASNKDMTEVWPDWMKGYSEEGVINYK